MRIRAPVVAYGAMLAIAALASAQESLPIPPDASKKTSDALSSAAFLDRLVTTDTGKLDEGRQAHPLSRGPLHEAFAARSAVNPKPAPLLPRRPPVRVNESPPDTTRQDSISKWIPGYWTWDEERDGYIWVSGICRKLPPGHRWVRGYWFEETTAFRWVAGYWSNNDQTEPGGLPAPPDALEGGPNVAAPSDGHYWVEGIWVYRQDAYRWRPGFWSRAYPNWVWVLACNRWTPNGYRHCDGYWDYPLEKRGVVYAPYDFRRPQADWASYRHTPRDVLQTDKVMSHLFVQPDHGCYYFGDYYGDKHIQRGIHSWPLYHRRHYSPMLAYYDLMYHRNRSRYQFLQHIFDYRSNAKDVNLPGPPTVRNNGDHPSGRRYGTARPILRGQAESPAHGNANSQANPRQSQVLQSDPLTTHQSRQQRSFHTRNDSHPNWPGRTPPPRLTGSQTGRSRSFSTSRAPGYRSSLSRSGSLRSRSVGRGGPRR